MGSGGPWLPAVPWAASETTHHSLSSPQGQAPVREVGPAWAGAAVAPAGTWEGGARRKLLFPSGGPGAIPLTHSPKVLFYDLVF